jgi:cohesin loading factor subunit SCC2
MHNLQGVGSSDCLLQRNELSDLGEQVKELVDRGLMCKVRSTEVVRLLDVLGAQMGLAERVDIDDGDDERSANVQDIVKALDAASISLLILGAEDMPKEVYREEGIDKIVDLIKYHMTHNVFVFVDASYRQIHRGAREDGNGGGGGDDDDPHKTPVQPSRRRKSTASASKRKSAGSAAKKAAVPKAVQTVNGMLSKALTQLANLLFVVHLPDATVLQMTNLGISALLVEDVDLIQTKAVDMVVAAFKHYPEHRGLVVDHILVTLLKLPAAGRGLRRYMFPDDDAHSIQVLTAMLMKCIQASVTFDDHSEAPGGEDAVAVASQPSETTGYGPAFRWSHYFWKELLKGWQSAKVQEVDLKSLMQNLVTDLLTTLNMPEWPVASPMLLSLCAQLLSSHGIKSSESKLREVSLDFIGQVAARIKGDMVECENDATPWPSLSRTGAAPVEGDESVAPEVIAAAESALSDVAASRTKDGASTSSAVQLVDGDDVDMLVLEAILLRYLHCPRAQSRAPTGRARAEPSAFTFSLAQLARESERKGKGFRSGTHGPGGDRRAYEELRGVLARHDPSPGGPATADLGTLPRDTATRLCRTLQQQQPLARQLDILVRRLLAGLEDAAITVRAAAVRAVGAVVDADPRVLGWDQVRCAVERRMTDNGTMVRSAIIGLLGRHVVASPDVAAKYYSAIVERVSDVGVSVRKHVINILHDCLRAAPNFVYRIGALRCLAFRILDDDVGIQELVVRIFRDLWFSPLPSGDGPDRGGGGEGRDPIAERAEQLVEVLWEVFCGVSRAGTPKLPLLSTFPMVAILRRVVFPSVQQGDAPAAASTPGGGKEGARGSKEMVAMARQLCDAILNGLLLHEEADHADAATKPPAGGGGDDDDDGGGGGISDYPRTVRYALGLHVFCATDPQLCVADHNPMAYATALHPYIKRCENTLANSMQLQCCISVVDAVVREAGCLAPATALEMEKDLRFLLLRNTYHGVLSYAARCICSIADARSNPEVVSGALQICRRFVKLLRDVLADAELSRGDRAHVSRALFVLGHMARFGAGVLEASGEDEVAPAALLLLFRSFLQRASAHEFDLKKHALQACGFLYVSRPQLMLSAKGGFGKGSMDGIMRAALSESAERGLKEQALLNLDEYLREEEARTLVQMSDDACAALGNRTNVGDADQAGPSSIPGTGGAVSRARRRRRAKEAAGALNSDGTGDGFQTINGEHDNSLANGVAQRYWPHVIGLCTNPEPAVRLKALHLAEVVLRQGLVHPMSCFPPLVALQADPVLNVGKLALRLLRQQHGKYPDFFDHQLGEGLELLFDFCKSLEAVARVAAKERPRGGGDSALTVAKVPGADDVNRGFENIYKLINNTRATRAKFLHALSRRFEGAVTASSVVYLCFLAKAIAALPFSMNDEPLFVIFHLNRIISLRASTLPETLQTFLARLDAEGEETSDVPEADLHQGVHVSLAACVMLALKRHLKERYELTDARSQAYTPCEALKPGEGFRSDGREGELDLSWVDPAAADTVPACRMQVSLFCSMMQNDTNDYAEHLRVVSKKRGGGRSVKGATAASPEPNGPTPGSPGDSGDPDYDGRAMQSGVSSRGQRSAALASTGAAEQKRGRGRRRETVDADITPRKKLAL